MDRMGLKPEIFTMLKFDGGFDGHSNGNFTCKQTLKGVFI